MRHSAPLLLTMIGMALVLFTGCIFDPPREKNCHDCDAVIIPPPSSPENLITALEIIYDDKVRGPSERLALYQDLLGPNFLFWFQEVDRETCGCENWGRDEEIQAHHNIFQKQESGEIYSLRVDISSSPATDLDPPRPEKPGWKRVFASNVFLELLNDPNNGFQVNGGQAEFLTQPGSGRWFIGEWTDLPRP